jgi:endonuclease VIII
MPEGDTIFRAARSLQKVLGGKIVTRFDTMLPLLQRIDHDTPLAGRTIEAVFSNGKWLTIRFSGDLHLLTHMLMNGSWHLYRHGEAWKQSFRDMRVLLETADCVAVAFNVSIAEFHTARSLARRPVFKDQGPDLLGEAFDPEVVALRISQRSDEEVGDVLLDQRVMAGLGNVYKSEVCFVSRVNPFTRVGDLAEAQVQRLTASSQQLLRTNAEGSSSGALGVLTFRRTTRRADPSARLYVYGRTGKPCLRCGTRILSRKQGEHARTTFWCPTCQPLPIVSTNLA